LRKPPEKPAPQPRRRRTQRSSSLLPVRGR
jgi:hypothetical protein